MCLALGLLKLKPITFLGAGTGFGNTFGPSSFFSSCEGSSVVLAAAAAAAAVGPIFFSGEDSLIGNMGIFAFLVTLRERNCGQFRRIRFDLSELYLASAVESAADFELVAPVTAAVSVAVPLVVTRLRVEPYPDEPSYWL